MLKALRYLMRVSCADKRKLIPLNFSSATIQLHTNVRATKCRINLVLYKVEHAIFRKYYIFTDSPRHSTALTTCRHVECQHENVQNKSSFSYWLTAHLFNKQLPNEMQMRIRTMIFKKYFYNLAKRT